MQRVEATSSLKKGEPISNFKTDIIAHQQTFRLLLPNCYCLVLNCYCLTSLYSFNNIWSLRTSIQARLVLFESQDIRVEVLWRKENPVLPQRQSKSLINKHVDCYCPTVTVSFLNCYSLTSPHIFNSIWS